MLYYFRYNKIGSVKHINRHERLSDCERGGANRMEKRIYSEIPVDRRQLNPVQSRRFRRNSPQIGGNGIPIPFANQRRKRIAYTVRQHGVTYISSGENLPGYEELSVYGEAFFKEKALILVRETVTSGSARVSIRSICLDNNVGIVTLSHEAPKIGTSDMATWLIWAEVDRGMDGCRWVLENPALGSLLQER